MRKLMTTIATAGLLSISTMSGVSAAPVAGFEALYAAVFANCTVPNGTRILCEAAINAYTADIVAANVDVVEANASLTALRLEVFTANEADEAFQAEIDALFELLLPDSGAIVSPTPVSPA